MTKTKQSKNKVKKMLLVYFPKLFSLGVVMYISISITSLILNQALDTKPGPWALGVIFSIIMREKVSEGSALGSTLEQTGLVRSSLISEVSMQDMLLKYIEF